jgi:hypothetical protein
MMPTVQPGGAAPARKKKSNMWLWCLIALLIVGSGVGLYFALREKPPRHMTVEEMERHMIDQLLAHFDQLNLPFDEARHELYTWYYKPLEGQGPDARPKYRVSDPIPLSEHQDHYIFEPNAVIVKGLPCNTRREDIKVFDNEHMNMGDKMLKWECMYENIIYFINKPNVIKDSCIRCGKHYALALVPDRPAATSEEDWNPEDRAKKQDKAHDAYFADIANKHNISPAELQKRIVHALVFKPIWPEDKDEIPPEKLLPEYYTGTIRFLRVKYFWDQAPRIHREYEGAVQRFHPLWPDQRDENNVMIRMGTQIFRRSQVWLCEANYEYRRGNIFWTRMDERLKKEAVNPEAAPEVKPAVLMHINAYAEDPEILGAMKEQEEKIEKRRAEAKKKGAASTPSPAPQPERPAETPKPEEKPEEKK